MNHVATMLPKPWGVTKELETWFKEIVMALDEIEVATKKGYWETGCETIDSLGIQELDYALDMVPDLKRAFSRSAVDRCALGLLTMWINEIKRRGREIISLSIMEIDVIDGMHALKQMRGLRYPI